MRRKWIIYGMLALSIVTTTECKAMMVMSPTEHVLITDEKTMETKDMATGQVICSGMINAYDPITKTPILYEDAETHEECQIFKYDRKGNKKPLLNTKQLAAQGEQLSSFLGIKDGYIYAGTQKNTGNQGDNALDLYIYKIDIASGRTVSKYDVRDKASQPVICNGKIYYSKKYKNKKYAYENNGSTLKRLTEGTVIGSGKNCIYVTTGNGRISSYNVVTNKVSGAIQLKSKDCYLIKDNPASDNILYYVTDNKIMKYEAGKTVKIGKISNSIAATKSRITDVLETDDSCYLGIFLENSKTKKGSTSLIRIDKKTKKAKTLFNTQVLSGYMPGLFYIENITLCQDTLYFNGPEVEKTDNAYFVQTKGMSYNLKTGNLTKAEEDWYNLLKIN